MRLAAVLIAGTAALAAVAPGSAAPQSDDYPIMEGFIDHAGLHRRFLLYDPKKQEHPALVIVLHGAGGNGGEVALTTKFVPLASREGFIVAFPEGTGTPASGRALAWNAGNCCATAMEKQIDDVGFISRLIDDAVAGLHVDPKRVYVTGISNGGMLTHRVGIELSDKVAAIAPVVGAIFGDEPAPRSPVSAMILVGALDRQIPNAGGLFGEKGRKIAPAKAAAEYWAKADGCQESTVTKDKVGTTTLYRGCRPGQEVQFTVVAGNGHAWPGAATPIASRALDATSAIWGFFKAHPKA